MNILLKSLNHRSAGWLAIGAVAVITACSTTAKDNQNNTDTVTVDIQQFTIAGVNLSQPFRVIGTEPFWNVDVAADEMLFAGLERDSVLFTTVETLQEDSLVNYKGESADGATLTLTLTAEECSDGMSDRVYPLSARVEMSGEVFTGCAASISFFNTAPAP